MAKNLHQGHYGGRSGAVPDSIVVVSYNIEYADDIDGAIADLGGDPQLAAADILLLQEMDADGTERLARTLGCNYVYWPAFVHRHHGRVFGTAVLSRWPIVGQDAVVLPHANPVDGHRRLAAAADIVIDNRVLRAVSVHLSTVVVDLEKRLQQIDVIIDSLQTVAGPVIIGGDFNSATDYEGTLFRRSMRKAGYREARLPAGRTASGGPLDWVGYDFVLDYIFSRDLQALETGIVRSTTASDHYPVWAVFRWPPQGDGAR